MKVNKKAKLIGYDYKKYNRDERELFPFYDYDNVLDVTKLNKIYNKETDFSEGLRMALEWYLNNKDNIIFKEDVEINEKNILKELGYI